MKLNRKICFNVFLGILVLVLISFLVYFSFFKQKKYVVFVENQEFLQELNSVLESMQINNSSNSKVIFTFTNERVLEKDTIVVGNISKISDFALNPFEKSENQEIFKLEEKTYIPSVKMDFNGVDANEYLKLPPDFSVYVTEIDKMPENHRGIKINEKYVTNEGYPLVKTTYLVVSVFYQEFKNPILDFLEQCFLSENCKINLVKSEESINPENQDPLFIAGVGDMMVGRGVQEILIYGKNGLNQVFNDTLPILQNSDFSMGNLEGAVTNFKDVTPKAYNFKFDKRVLPSLKAAGFDYLMINNNHIFDYGKQGFLDSLAALKEAGIPTSGVGKNYEEASSFYFTKVKNQDIAVISIGAFPKEKTGFDGASVAATETEPGVLWKNDKIYEDIKSLKEKGYLIIASVHDGYEYNFAASESQIEFAKKLVDSGVDLVLETHAHVLQPIERYKDGLIVYGLGNFIFPGMEEMAGGTDSLVLRVGFVDGKPIYVEPFPCKIDGTKVNLD